MKTIILLFIAATFATTAVAHNGETDASGCHTSPDTGIYHCHQGLS